MLKGAWTRWSLALGFALGGFFDGVLLHQILQWHHLLSLVPAVSSLRLQVLWDGYFHALMYLIAAVALWGLWRSRGEAPPRAASTPGAVLLGFGLWHTADALLSHWLLGIHRIRLDSGDPLAWDLLWLGAFGLVPMLAALALLKRGGPPQRPGRSSFAVLLLGLVAGGAALWASRPPPDQPDFTTVVFRPGAGAEEVFGALAATDARLVWSDPAMSVVVLQLDPQRRWSLYGHGALLVSGSGAPPGCFAWSRA